MGEPLSANMMSEPTITDWIGAVANGVTAIVVLCGLYIAMKQLDAWRTEARTRRRSEIAEQLIIAAHNVSDALKVIRAPIMRVPAEKAEDKTYTYQVRYERIDENKDLFNNLRQAQIRAKAVIDDQEVDEAINKLFDIRSEVAAAILSMADEARMDEYSADPDGTLIEFRIKMRRTIYGSYSEKDLVGTQQLTALETILKSMGSIARLEGK